jgi:hypothetical protein
MSTNDWNVRARWGTSHLADPVRDTEQRMIAAGLLTADDVRKGRIIRRAFDSLDDAGRCDPGVWAEAMAAGIAPEYLPEPPIGEDR